MVPTQYTAMVVVGPVVESDTLLAFARSPRPDVGGGGTNLKRDRCSDRVLLPYDMGVIRTWSMGYLYVMDMDLFKWRRRRRGSNGRVRRHVQ